eukprot:TRINITY_DN8369_c0_g1_i1.p1 TRINITY_DN8369_c0_g1~~TRINITY_DN8369_c0_g1_i1.p1  ORF type:complete len:106 (+),score=14.95 TRINITY_DN8369_c0_g1_i1:47-364(+)
MNQQSSRSHSIFTLYIKLKQSTTDGSSSGPTKTTRYSRLHLIDLAGSERQKMTQTSGSQLKEARRCYSNEPTEFSQSFDIHTIYQVKAIHNRWLFIWSYKNHKIQ